MKTVSHPAPKKRPHGVIALVALATVISGWILPHTLAQLIGEEQSPDEKIQIGMGEVFEIIADTAGEESFISWVLTREREFVEAGSNRSFSVRLTEPGLYLLETAAASPVTGKRIRKNILLTVSDRPATPGVTENNQGLATVEPPESGGSVIVQSWQSIIRIDPADGDGPITLDLDANTDTNADGITDNDNDTAATLFTDDRTPLHVWMVTLPVQRTMLLRSGTQTQVLDVRSAEGSGTPGPVQNPGELLSEQRGDGIVAFQFETDSPASNIVHHWTFGDGGQSLQSTPVHQYRLNGNYTVEVIVRSLRDGSTVDQATQTVIVDSVREPTATGGTVTPPVDEPPVVEPEPAQGGGLLRTILLIAGIGILAIAIGAAGAWIVSLIRKRAASSGLTTDTGKGPGGDAAKQAIDIAPPPLELKRQTPTPEPEPQADPEPEPTPEPAPPPQDTVDIEKAPSWLRKGLGEPVTGTAPQAPAPIETTAEPETPAPPPAPAPVTEEVQAPTEEVTPPWLQNPTPPPAQPVATDATPPPSFPASVETSPSLPPELTAQPEIAPIETQPEPAGTSTEQFAAPAPAETSPVQTEVPAAPAEPTPSEQFTPATEPAPAPYEEQPAPWDQPVATGEPTATPVDTAPTFPEQTSPAAELAQPAAEPVMQPDPAPAPVEPAPTTESTPATEQVTASAPTPEPPAAPVATPAPSTPSPVQPAAATITDADRQRQERERERKRLKRQRYRENLKKRRTEEVQKTNATPAPVAPTPAPAPAPVQTPAEPAPVTPAPQPVAPVAPSVPTPTAPIEPQTPAAPAAEAAPNPPSDDSVAFMIRAEGVPQKPEETK